MTGSLMHETSAFTNSGRTRLCVLFLALMMSAAALTPMVALAADSKASKYYEDALIRYEKKDVAGAIIQLKNALQIDKSMLPVQMLLGKALLQSGDVQGAEVAFNEALRLGVNRAEVVVPLGQALLAQGKHKVVLEQQQFSPIGLASGVQLELFLLRSTASLDLGDTREAMKAVEEARTINPKLAEVWLAEVPIRVRTRQFPEALAAAERALILAPESAESWYQKGSIAHVSGNLNETLQAYDTAIQLNSSHVETRVARAGLYIDFGRQSDAAKDIDELKRIAPNEPRASYLQALLAEHNNQPEVARKALKTLVGLIDPVPIDFIRYRPQLLMLNGLAHFGLNETEKAKQYLEPFQRNQSNSPASKLLAQIYLSEGNENRAIEVLEAYLKATPSDGQAMTLLGSALMTKGQYSRAASLMQHALETRDSPEFRTVLGLSLIRGGKTGSGLGELESAYKKDPRQITAATALVGQYLQSGQASKAVPIAERLVKQQAGNAGFFNLLGMAHGQAGNLTGAKKAFDQAVKLDAKLMAPKLNLARIAIAGKAYDTAAKRLGEILAIDGKNTEAMFQMAALSERLGQVSETQRWLEKANDLSGPKEVRWTLALSNFHLQNNRPGPALIAARQAFTKAPEDLSVLLATARAHLAGGDITSAKSMLISATRVADYHPSSQLQIALLQLAANNTPGAAYSLEKALSTEPNFLPAMTVMAEVELRMADPAKSEKRARDIVSKHPKMAVGHRLLGDVAVSRGQAQAALDAYRRAHQLEPSTETLLRLFRTLTSQDDDKPALQLAEQWIKANPKDSIIQKALADSYARAGNFSLARVAYEKLLKITPDDGEAINNLANVLLRLKDPGAVKMAELAVEKSPGNANAIDTLGWALYQTGQMDRGLQFLRDARLREPGNPEIRYHLAVVLAQTGRKTEARDELEAALKSGAMLEDKAAAAALLKSLK